MKNENGRERVTVHLELPEKLYLKLAARSRRIRRPVEEVILSSVRRDISNSLKQKEKL